MKLPKTRLTDLFVTATMIAMAQSGLAQTSGAGALTGTVTDTNRALVAGAKVKVANEATGESRVVVTGADGQYRVPLLPPGSYRVEVVSGGFKTATRSGLSVVVTETITFNIVLEVGATTDSVTVQS